MGGGESTLLLRDRWCDLRVFTKLGFHASGIDRQDIAARRVSILGYAKRYWIVQGDCLCRVYNSVSIIKRANLVTIARGLALSPVPAFTAEETPLQERVCPIRYTSTGIHHGYVPNIHEELRRDWMGSTHT